MYQFASSVATQNRYPPKSLACKTYNMTKMDCSNRNLPDVPVLDQDLTTLLNLSHNQLKNITCAPFEKLKVLLMLNLSYNEISQMSSTAFRGLQSLESLKLNRNKLVDLPKNVFSDLHKLQYLNMDANFFTVIPGQVLAPLVSLRTFTFLNVGDISEIKFEGFENMTNLNTLGLFMQHVDANISLDTFYPLRKLPLRTFKISWTWIDGSY